MGLETLGFLSRETWIGARRHPLMSIASTVNVGVSLTILAVGALAVLNVGHIADQLLEKGQIGVFLADGGDRENIEARILGDERVEATEFVPKSEGLRRMESVYEMPLVGLIERNPIPDKIVVSLRRPDQIANVAADIENLEGVENVNYGGRAQDRVIATSRALKWGTLVVGVLLILGTFLIIQSTVRLTVHARRREIRIMQLVGATDWFVRIPFILEGVLYGVAGAALASVTVLVAYFWAQDYVEHHLTFVPMLYSSGLFVTVTVALIVAGCVFGGLSSLISMRRYLREA
ncbi:MAG: permease-like cell division protein FtsX [Armatimonadota bacterium]|jgi:cell division transport system permease protein